MLDEFRLLKRVKQSGPWWSRGDAHAVAQDLPPICVTKFDCTVIEDNMEGCGQCFGIGEWVLGAEFHLYVLENYCESRFCFDVCVH